MLDTGGVEDALEEGHEGADLKVGVRKVSAVTEVDARAAGALESRAFFRGILACSTAFAASAEVNLNAVAVDLYVGNRDPVVAFNADTLFLEKFGQVFEVEAAVIEPLVGFGVHVDVYAILVSRHIEKGLYVLAQESLGQ